MKASELRIGNLVKSALTGETLEVDWLVIKHISNGNMQSVYKPHEKVYLPIPLTAEILEKAGFEKATDNRYGGWLSLADKHGQRLRIREWEHGFFHTPSSASEPIYLYHLHQLQNLYFALTGEELNIEL